jgi:hypothetical protein
LGDPDLISAKAFAAQTGAWRQLTPALDQFTRWVNENTARVGTRIPRLGPKERSAFIAEAAFGALASGTGPTTSVQAAAFDMLAPLPRGPGTPDLLSVEEEREVFGVMANTLEYVERFPGAVVTYRPKFPGCGTVRSAEGDVQIERELIEIKAVDRPFRGSDFRQVLTYAALAHASGTELEIVTLLNPRLATFFSSPVQTLALDLGAGSWFDLMHELIELMSQTGVSN